MFTGIVEEVGIVKQVKSPLIITCSKILEDIHIGDSIAVNGACLTATKYSNNTISFDVMNETYNRTNLDKLKIGSKVNLERAMSANGRFGGHIVSGHIDGIGKISNIKNDGISIWYTISTTNEILKYIVEKGSVTLDGISLTVAKVTDKDFKVSIIPHTQVETTLGDKKIGDSIAIENDIVGKYIEKFINFKNSNSIFNFEFLENNGF